MRCLIAHRGTAVCRFMKTGLSLFLTCFAQNRREFYVRFFKIHTIDFNELSERKRQGARGSTVAGLEFYDRVTHFIRGSTIRSAKSSTTVVDFRPLYAVTIYNLQRQLTQEIQLVKSEILTDLQLAKIQRLLEEYSQSSKPPPPPRCCYTLFDLKLIEISKCTSKL